MKPYLYGVLVLLIAIILLQYSWYNKQTSTLESKIAISNVEKQTLKKTVNSLGDTITYQKALIIEDKNVLDTYADSIFSLKKDVGKTITYYQNRIKIRVDSFETHYTDTVETPVYITDSYARDSMVTVPRTFAVDSPYFKIQGLVKKDGVTINNLELKDTLSGRFTEISRGFFREPDIEYQVLNKNPYIRVEGINSIIYKPKKKGIKKVIPFIIGIGVGILITK